MAMWLLTLLAEVVRSVAQFSSYDEICWTFEHLKLLSKLTC